MDNDAYLDRYEDSLHNALFQLLQQHHRADTRFPSMPDIEDKFELIVTCYLEDGIREFNQYPMVSLGWMMYVGMAVAHYWDTDWDTFIHQDDPYRTLRDRRCFDYLDETVRGELMGLQGETYQQEERLVQTFAEYTLSALRHENIEPSTPLAFHAYIRSLRQLYLHGAASELYRLGYKMTALSL